MFVFFPEDAKVGVKTIKNFAERMKSEGVARAIMVVASQLTPFAKQCLEEMRHKYYIEVVRPPNCSNSYGGCPQLVGQASQAIVGELQ